ncbi:MAG: DUF2235 domain-containing protein [Rhodobacteraceae bacterium]|nr:DUF2235 domain-containing protein [Paracoccaceae bacterium]
MQPRTRRKHIIIVDGTQSQLHEGTETNAGLLYKLLCEAENPDRTSIWYHPGIQGHGFWNWATIASGWGISGMILEAYTQLASKYQPGDKIYLFGFSRGAYAVRSVAGMINQLGLLRQSFAYKRKIDEVFRLYERNASGPAARSFGDIHCHRGVEIEMIGVWDTVKALGLPYPLLTYLAPMATEFHNDRICAPVKNGFHALAMDENRQAYRPVMWETDPAWLGHLEQAWFRGSHSDIGGHVGKHPQARPLSNIPLVWMLERAAVCGLVLPEGWAARFPCDVNAPAVGNTRGIARFFLLRNSRLIGEKPGEYIHASVVGDLNSPEPVVPLHQTL